MPTNPATDPNADDSALPDLRVKRFELPVKESAGHQFGRAEAEVIQFGDEEPMVSSFPFGGCQVCDTRPKAKVIGDAIHVEDPCLYPDGITTKITLAVPSGKLLVSDDLRPVYNWSREDLACYNTTLGQAQAIEAMAAIGCAYGPASNCSLGLYRTGQDRYIVASPSIDFDNDEVQSPPEETRMAHICTDLWAYSIADFEHWRSNGGDPESLDWGDTVVTVPPGVYQFTHHSGERSFDADSGETVVFADIERIA